MSTHTTAYTRAHTAAYVTDKLANSLRDIIKIWGLNPAKLIDDWELLSRGVRTWLESGHLTQVTLEFYSPGSTQASGRVDMPVEYDGSGVADEMWVDKAFLRAHLGKGTKPGPGVQYRVLLTTSPGEPEVPGFVATTYRSTSGLVSRNAGSVIATGDVMVSLRYWRTP